MPLDETGRSQALFWKKALARIQFDSIYTSTLSRCRETAAIICPLSQKKEAKQNIYFDDRLNEINLGTWDGQSFGHIKAAMPELFDQRGKEIRQFCPPEGESFADLYERVSPFFKNLCQNLAAPVLVITHSGVIRVMLCQYLGLNPTQLLTIKPGYGDLFVLEKTSLDQER